MTLILNKASKKYGKRLETVDGVEIASSYIEYLDLALGDLEDRLKKSTVKSIDFKERISKRTSLLNEIIKEVDRRRQFSNELSSKDKLLRTRLIRNTEMKSALQNLADIAGYKLNPIENSRSDESVNTNNKATNLLFLSQNYPILLNDSLENHPNSRNITSLLVDSLSDIAKNNTYNRYIEMAYKEVTNILTNDKQALIEVIRKLKTNEFKLKELEQLKIKVNASLKRLISIESRLSNMIIHDSEIAKTVRQLEKQIKKNQLDENKTTKTPIESESS
jgi:hypothetical protein